MVQRAIVLAGRDRSLRQHVRRAQLETLWAIEDWGISWTLRVDRGRLEFDRRPSERAALTLRWARGEDFFSVGRWRKVQDGNWDVAGAPDDWKYFEPIFRAFFSSLEKVIADPVDDDGTTLV